MQACAFLSCAISGYRVASSYSHGGGLPFTHVGRQPNWRGGLLEAGCSATILDPIQSQARLHSLTGCRNLHREPMSTLTSDHLVQFPRGGEAWPYEAPGASDPAASLISSPRKCGHASIHFCCPVKSGLFGREPVNTPVVNGSDSWTLLLLLWRPYLAASRNELESYNIEDRPVIAFRYFNYL